MIIGAIVIGATLLYARRGAFAATATFLITLIAVLAAFNYYELIEYLLVKMYKGFAPYADAVGLLASFLVVFLALQYAAMALLEETIDINHVISGVAGAVFGGLAGFLLAGLLAISWLMMPGSSYYVGDEGAHVFFDADKVLLTTVRFMANERINGQQLFDPTYTFMERSTYKFAKPASQGGSVVGAMPRGNSEAAGFTGDTMKRDIEELD